jgi:hypothetical protein
MAENSDQQIAGALRQRQRAARADRALNLAGNTAKAGGTVAQYGGKAGGSFSRGMTKGGESMMEAGGEMSSTGLGAIVGVPLAVVGAGVAGIGTVGQGISKGAERGGQAMRQTGNRMNQLPLRPEKQHQSNDGTKSVLGSLRHRARQYMPSAVAKGEMALVGAFSVPAKMATSEALATAWINFLDNYIFSFIYINLHVLGRLTLGTDFFGKLGHEWAGSIPGTSSMAETNVVAKKLNEFIGDNIGLIEVIALLIIDLIALMLFVSLFVLVVLIVYAFTYPADAIGKLLGVT